MVIRPYPDTLVLTSVCQHPFATVSVLSGLNDVGEQRVKRSLDRLMAGGLVDRIWHASSLLPRSRRYYPLLEGLDAVAKEASTSMTELVTELPVSYERLKWTAHRLDSVANIYELAATVARADKLQFPEDEPLEIWSTSRRITRILPVTVSLYSTLHYDAIIRLRLGRTIGIIRQGLARSRSSLADRIYHVSDLVADRPGRSLPYRPGKVVILTATPWEAQVVDSSYFAETWRGPLAVVVPENLAALREVEYAAWDIVDDLQPSGASLPPLVRPSAISRVPTHCQLMEILKSPSFRLSRREKEVLDVVADLVLITRRELSVFLARNDAEKLSDNYLSEVMGSLVNKHHMIRQIGGRGKTRYALGDPGITYMSERDRIRIETAKEKWSSDLVHVDSRTSSRRYKGSLLNGSRKYRDHDDGVHWLLARLKRGIEALEPHWEFLWFLPTHRTKREWERTAIVPDAIVGSLYHDPEGHAVRMQFMVEYERRDIYPVRSRKRLNHYIRYFWDGLAGADHQGVPLILFVFDNDAAESRFLSAATDTGVQLPIYTSNRGLLSPIRPSHFMMANAWRTYPIRPGRVRRYALAGRVHAVRRTLPAWQTRSPLSV